jgi:hypothetical protein
LSEEEEGSREIENYGAEEELDETLAQALRPPQRGDLEQILASNLAAAVFARPIDKIRMIFEAFLLLPGKEQAAIATDEGRQCIKELYEVAVSLSSLVEEPAPPYLYGRFASVPWSFPNDQGWRYLRRFMTRVIDLSFYLGPEAWSSLRARMEKNDESAWDTYLNTLTIYLGSGLAPLTVAKMVEAEYCICVMPFASALFRKIFTRFISKETWEKTLTIIGKPKRST